MTSFKVLKLENWQKSAFRHINDLWIVNIAVIDCHWNCLYVTLIPFQWQEVKKGNPKLLWPLKVILKSKQPPHFLQLGLRQNAAKLRAAPFRYQSFSTQNIVLYYITSVLLCQNLMVSTQNMPSHPQLYKLHNYNVLFVWAQNVALLFITWVERT